MSKELDSILSDIISSLEENIEYVDNLSDPNKFPSYTSFVFSRIFDKFVTLIFNYRRVKAFLTSVTVRNLNDNLRNKELEERLKAESDLEMTSSILRPLYEMYLEILSIKLSFTKVKDGQNGDALELFCHTLYISNYVQDKTMQLNFCKDFYDCQPIYLINSVKELSPIMNTLRQDFSKKNLPLLYTIRNKLLEVMRKNDTKERYLLGMDYLTSYVMLSRKNHFSYSNIITPQFKNDMFLNWCLILFISAYLEISEFLHFEPIRKDELFKFKVSLSEKVSEAEQNNISIGNYVIFEFGIAEVKNKNDLTIQIEFVVSNQFQRGIEDVIPKVYVQKEVSPEIFKSTFEKYYSCYKDLYLDEDYEKLHNDLMRGL